MIGNGAGLGRNLAPASALYLDELVFSVYLIFLVYFIIYYLFNIGEQENGEEEEEVNTGPSTNSPETCHCFPIVVNAK